MQLQIGNHEKSLTFLTPYFLLTCHPHIECGEMWWWWSGGVSGGSHKGSGGRKGGCECSVCSMFVGV